MKRNFEKGDLVVYTYHGEKVLASVENVWRSRESLSVRPLGQHEKFEVEIGRVKKVL